MQKKITKLRATGKYEDFMNDIIKKNKLSEIKDITIEFEEWLDSSSTFVTEAGEIEDWKGNVDKEQLRAKFKKELEEWKKHLEEL